MGRRILRAWAAAAICVGCSSGDEAPGTGQRGQDIGRLPTAIAGTGSDAPTSNDDAPPAFDNSNVTPPEVSTIDAGDGCQVGMRCGPTEPDPDDCGSLTLEAEVEVIENPGNVLLVFDRSQSMADQWGQRTRWEEAGDAIENAIGPLADLLTVGSVFFPSSDPNAPTQCVDPTGIACIFVPFLAVPTGGCLVNPITEADQLPFAPGPDFLTAFTGPANAAPLYAPIPLGFTPLKEALQEAQSVLASTQLTGLTSVIVITDGDPNCEWDAATATGIVADWAANGIKTYVIGLPGGLGGMGVQVLNDLASTGGTGEYIEPTDAAALEQRLRDIATETVQQGFDSCEISITPPAEVPDKLNLVATEAGEDWAVDRQLADDASWNVTDDGSLVTLEGGLCDDAKEGRFDALRFEFGCVELPPLPPDPPVE